MGSGERVSTLGGRIWATTHIYRATPVRWSPMPLLTARPFEMESGSETRAVDPVQRETNAKEHTRRRVLLRSREKW